MSASIKVFRLLLQKIKYTKYLNPCKQRWAALSPGRFLNHQKRWNGVPLVVARIDSASCKKRKNSSEIQGSLRKHRQRREDKSWFELFEGSNDEKWWEQWKKGGIGESGRTSADFAHIEDKNRRGKPIFL